MIVEKVEAFRTAAQPVRLHARFPAERVRGRKTQKEHAGEVSDEEMATERWENEGGRTELASLRNRQPHARSLRTRRLLS